MGIFIPQKETVVFVLGDVGGHIEWFETLDKAITASSGITGCDVHKMTFADYELWLEGRLDEDTMESPVWSCW